MAVSTAAAAAATTETVLEVPDSACDNVCSICETGGPDDDLLLCEGFCLRAFHAECLDMEEAPPAGKYWACFDCTHGLQRCFVCKQYDRSRRMVKCTFHEGRCGKWYHIACAPRKLALSSDGSTDSANEDMDFTQSYICPQHICNQCGSTDVKTKCLKCTKAYCEKCRPAAVHLLDDRRYFTCVEHLQGATLPPIPVRFMEKLVTCRMKNRTRCPAKHRQALEKAKELEKSRDVSKKDRHPDNGSDSDGENEMLMSVDQLLSLREERALEYLKRQNVRMDSKQKQKSDLLKGVSVAISSSVPTTISEGSRHAHSSSKRKSNDALEKLQAAMNRQARPRKKARVGNAHRSSNFMPTASFVAQFQANGAGSTATLHTNIGATNEDAPAVDDTSPFGNRSVDMAPFGSNVSNFTATWDRQKDSSPTLSQVNESHESAAEMSKPQTIGEIRASVLKMVTTMLEQQRQKVAQLREQVGETSL